MGQSVAERLIPFRSFLQLFIPETGAFAKLTVNAVAFVEKPVTVKLVNGISNFSWIGHVNIPLG
jgi:hypothetical protein